MREKPIYDDDGDYGPGGYRSREQLQQVGEIPYDLPQRDEEDPMIGNGSENDA